MTHSNGSHNIQRVNDVNAPWTSPFEKWELMVADGSADPWILGRGDAGQEQVAVWERIDGYPEWTVKATFDVGRDQLTLVGLAVTPASLSPPADGLNTDVWKRIRFLPLHANANAWSELPAGVRPMMDLDRDKAGRIRRPGRVGRSNQFYAERARVYVEETARGPKPIPRLASDWNLNEASVRSLLHEARRRGLLTAAPRGRAGGQLTAKAKRILVEPPEEDGS